VPSRALSVLLVFVGLAAAGDRVLVRIYVDSPEQARLLDGLGLDFASEALACDRDAVVTEEQLAEVRARGFKVEVRQRQLDFSIPTEYHDYLETQALFSSLQTRHPEMVHIDTIGWSLWRHDPIWGVRISDNPSVEEDEPAILLTGVTHAREPMGNEIIIHLAKYLCAGYDTSPAVRRWVDSLELWLIPIVNIDGYQWMFDSATADPWWRKNQRDNNANGRFDKDYDGVDLNRNFDWRWTYGGDTVPSSEVYRCPYAGSEPEVQAWCDLSRRHRPVFGVGYHSYGNVVIYPWRQEGDSTPDEDILLATAQTMAQRIGYTARWTGGSNGSAPWSYGCAGVLDFFIETGYEFIPPGAQIPGICAANFNADTFLLNRMFYGAVRGHTRDADTDSAVVAEVQVLGRVDTALDPRVSDSAFGRYWCALKPGVYSLRFIAAGYETLTKTGLRVSSDSLTRFEARLRRAAGVALGRDFDLQAVTIVPNPFIGSTAAPGAGPEELLLYDAGGRLVERCSRNRIAAAVPAGVYWLRPAGAARAVPIVKLR
jgi:hypothetical protein